MANPDLRKIVANTKQAAQKLAFLSADQKNVALAAIGAALATHSAAILSANQADVAAAQAAQLAKPLIDRLKLNAHKLADMIAGVGSVAGLADPTGQRQIHRELDEGLILERVTVPLGVLGVIFESRPDAVTQIVSLAIKSGNGVILKGGQEALRSCETLVEIIQAALHNTDIPAAVVQLVTSRGQVQEILAMEKEIDLVIPRGSNDFVRFIQENTRIPVLGHADGLCHLYVDAEADIEQAIVITIDSKTQYPAACNAIETLLVHRAIAPQFLPPVMAALTDRQVTVRGCELTQKIIPEIQPASAQDWQAEYCDLVLAIKVVDSLAAAIGHINSYGSRHTEAIVTTNPQTAQQFRQEVDAAGIYHNCSTRFADGFRYGFGAEVGISTQKMPPRGPVGLEGLVTYRYYLSGTGQLVATYSGAQPRSFTHRDL